ncbi:hypothetical protein MANES_07G117704v8 [Manihot esculenta]|uniref:Uncharacterized protein n=1 Tax=Manihot esculenta TaxID=3983 RepID=A0ACB7HGS9_MANES|nr:hypothetical protein MANES_07G117704v8 [Manihot esculenta]
MYNCCWYTVSLSFSLSRCFSLLTNLSAPTNPQIHYPFNPFTSSSTSIYTHQSFKAQASVFLLYSSFEFLFFSVLGFHG